MNNLSNERLEQIAYGSVRQSAEEGVWMARELLSLREAGKEPVRRVNADQMYRVCLEATRHLDKYGAMAKEVNKLLGRIPAPQLPAVPEYPELLPCPVFLEPGFRFGKGVKTRLLFDALSRRAEYYAGLEAMTPEERTERDAGIAAFKSLMGGSKQRLAAAVELLKQAAPHMLADESLKDPDGALCGKVRAVPGELTIDGATEKLTVEYSLSNTGVTGFRDGWNACLAAIAAASKPE